MFHRIILVLTLFSAIGLVAVGCTGSDTTTEIVKIKCQGSDDLVEDVADCPPVTPPTTPPPTTPPPTTPPPTTTPDPDDDRAECNINAVGKAAVEGSSEDDVICGDDDNNTINAKGGEDIVRAGDGNDKVDGGPGNDELYGEAGNDNLSGGEDEDIIDGGPGDDELIGNEGRDELRGGEGSDTVIYTGMTNEDLTLAALTGFEINLANGFSLDEYGDQDEYDSIENVTITGSGAYKVVGNSVANRIDGGTGAVADNDLDGGEGDDTLIVGLAATLDATGNSNFENLEARVGVAASLDLTGNSKANVIKGGNSGGTLAGMGGNDRLYAGTGGSTLNGGEGDDTLVGGAGVDNLIGGAGRDTLTGNEGNDCFLFEITDPVTTDRVTDFGEGDTVSVTGTSPAGLAQAGGTLSVQAKAGNIVIVETYDHDSDSGTPDRETNRATVANVGSKLANAATISGTSCP